jgi:hypothetical protein
MRNKPLLGMIYKVSTQGYQTGSLDEDASCLVIDSDDITMAGVDKPITGVSLVDGKTIKMKPGVKHYKFWGPVLEFPTK